MAVIEINRTSPKSSATFYRAAFVDMTIADREISCASGASGCGKTTLVARIIRGTGTPKHQADGPGSAGARSIICRRATGHRHGVFRTTPCLSASDGL